MALTGVPFLLLLLGLAAGLVLLALRPVRPGRAGVAGRLVTLLALLAVGAAIAADQANREFQFYGSFAELTGTAPAAVRPTTAPAPGLPAGALTAGRAAAARGRGVVQTWRLAGARSGVTRAGLVYLPAAYFDPRRAPVRYPVLELLPGSPGGPSNWLAASGSPGCSTPRSEPAGSPRSSSSHPEPTTAGGTASASTPCAASRTRPT